MGAHARAVELTLGDDETMLDGEYFTGRGRTNHLTSELPSRQAKRYPRSRKHQTGGFPMDWKLALDIFNALGITSISVRYLIDRRVEHRDELRYLLDWLTGISAAITLSSMDARPRPETRRLRPSLYPFIHEVESWAAMLRLLEQKGLECLVDTSLKNEFIGELERDLAVSGLPDHARALRMQAYRAKYDETMSATLEQVVRAAKEIIRILIGRAHV